MAKRSAGLLLFRRTTGSVEVLLVHPGGPFWAKRDAGAWSIPKGEVESGEDDLAAARREFREETGLDLPDGPILPLGEAVQPSRKVVVAFALEADLDATEIRSTNVEIAWPPRSGRRLLVPEVDRAEWFSEATAADKILPGQRIFLERLADGLRSA